jgi:hypothetical protein
MESFTIAIIGRIGPGVRKTSSGIKSPSISGTRRHPALL